MKKIRMALLPLLALGCCGCASLVRLEIPDEFKKKKLKEDPPISLIQPPAPRSLPGEA